MDCLRQTDLHSDDVIIQAIRKSLKGEAALVTMKLGHQPSISDILNKLRSAFGTLRRRSHLLSECYSSRQLEDEDVATWSCRLERLLFQLSQQRYISPEEQDEMLRTRLWDGLNLSLKTVAGYKYDAISNFDDLRLCLREMEFDLKQGSRDRAKAKTKTETKTETKTATANMATTAEDSRQDDIAELKGMVRELKKQVTSMQGEQASAQSFQQVPYQYRPPYRGQGQNGRRQGKGVRDWGRGRGRVFYERVDRVISPNAPNTPVHRSTPTTDPPTQDTASGYTPVQSSQEETDASLPICGYPGHLSYGCRIRTDFRKRPLNSYMPVARGHP